jgi:hypothetical protein
MQSGHQGKKQQQEVATGVWPFFSFDIMNNKHTNAAVSIKFTGYV